jgi:hypothetical protein
VNAGREAFHPLDERSKNRKESEDGMSAMMQALAVMELGKRQNCSKCLDRVPVTMRSW